MNWKNVKLIFHREVRDQLRDRRTLFMITVLPVLLYPMLGLGIVEMMLTFSEGKRTVVILNADQFPTDPAFLDESGIAEDWFDAGAADASRLRVITDRSLPPDAAAVAGKSDEAGNASAVARSESEMDRTRELIRKGRKLAAEFETFQSATEVADDDASLSVVQDRLSYAFSESGIQVLVIVPDGYAAAIAGLQENSMVDENQSADELPPLRVLRNSADDKSVVAFGRVRDALHNWEGALRARSFERAAIRPELHHPAQLKWVEIARGQEVAANVWSKLFPALIVIMALTGAFYPAIDLGAGEKERGTMETLLISPAKRVELVLGKFLTVLMFSIGTALMNLLSMGFTGQHMASAMAGGLGDSINLQFPGGTALVWLVVLLVPLAALFSALCLALATFAKSTKEGQYYLTPLLMVILGLTMFCLNPAMEITPLYSVIPVVNVALLLKGLLLSSAQSSELLVYAVPVLISSIGYSVLALWWAIDLYNSEGVLFREAEKFDLKSWFLSLTRDKEPVPAFQEAAFCFIMILFLQFIAMNYMQTDLNDPAAGHKMMQAMVIQQLTMIACPAVFMGLLLTTSLRATFRLRMPSLSSMLMGIGLAVLAHPLSVELSSFVVERGLLPAPPQESFSRITAILKSGDIPTWLIMTVFAVTPAICEEIAFRGFILSGLARGGRLGVAIIISSMMFGIVHMIPQQAFNAALLGLILGLLAVHSRSLFPAIAFHFCNNAIASLHAGNGFGIRPDGVFLSEDQGVLRYELPTLILCGIGVAFMVVRMVRDLRIEQEQKRQEQLKSFDAPSESNNLAAGI